MDPTNPIMVKPSTPLSFFDHQTLDSHFKNAQKFHSVPLPPNPYEQFDVNQEPYPWVDRIISPIKSHSTEADPLISKTSEITSANFEHLSTENPSKEKSVSLSHEMKDEWTPVKSVKEVEAKRKRKKINLESNPSGRYWTPKEDAILTHAAKKDGKKNWRMIAEEIGIGKTKKQCRDRWTNFLDPELCNLGWSKKEDSIILCEVENGNKSWSKIIDAIKENCQRKRNNNDVKYRSKELVKRRQKTKRLEQKMKKNEIKEKESTSESRLAPESDVLPLANFSNEDKTSPSEGLFILNSFGDLF